MEKCSSSHVPVHKGDKFSLNQCPKNDLERKQMKNIPYASIVWSLIYAQTCTRLAICFVIEMQGRYQSNHWMDQWKDAKKMLWYLQGTKEYMLICRIYDHLDVVGYSNYVGSVNKRKIHIWIFIFIRWKSNNME